MSNVVAHKHLWAMTHSERADLADDLVDLDDPQLRRQSLRGQWVVKEVVAHLTAAASIGRLRWLSNVLGARFDFDNLQHAESPLRVSVFIRRVKTPNHQAHTDEDSWPTN